MRREIIRIQNTEDEERDFHFLVTSDGINEEGVEDITAHFMMTQEEREALIQHLVNIADVEGVVGFTITFGVRSGFDPNDGLRVFTESIKNKTK